MDAIGEHAGPIEPPRPLGAWLIDYLLLLSPRTWLGLFLFQSKSPFAPLDVNAIVKNMMGIVVPWIVIHLLRQLLNGDSQRPSAFLKLHGQVGFLSCYMLSPWTLACALELASGLGKFGLRLQNYQVRRMPALPEAVSCLRERVQCGRAIRYRQFDVFLPKASTKASSQEEQRRVILFLPGLLVSHVSYSPVAARLSDEGFTVLILSMEPWRMAFQHLGADRSRIAKIQHILRRTLLRNHDNHETISWVLMGHSMGTFAAMRLAAELCKPQSSVPWWRPTAASAEMADYLVMWAAATFPGWSTPLPSRVQTLVVQGSRDTFYRSTLPHRSRFLRDFSQSRTKHVIIPGANHDNFGSYSTERLDDATMSRDKQQALACRLTAQFLKTSKP